MSVKVQSIATKLLSHNPRGGDDEYSIKIKVRNQDGRRQPFVIDVQGLDGDGFEIAEVQFRGELEAEEERDSPTDTTRRMVESRRSSSGKSRTGDEAATRPSKPSLSSLKRTTSVV